MKAPGKRPSPKAPTQTQPQVPPEYLMMAAAHQQSLGRLFPPGPAVPGAPADLPSTPDV